MVPRGLAHGSRTFADGELRPRLVHPIPRLGWATSTRTYGVRGTAAKATGRWYWEVRGGTYVGAAAEGWDGQLDSLDAVLPFNTSGDWVGFGLDADARTLTIYRPQGATTTHALPSTAGAFVPAVFTDEGSASANFGAAPFALAVPAGYQPLFTP